MATKTIFTMKLDPELRDRFMAEAAKEGRPAAQVMRELMRHYIDGRREAREYGDFVRRKVEIARKQRAAGLYITHEEVEAESERRVAELLQQADKAGL